MGIISSNRCRQAFLANASGVAGAGAADARVSLCRMRSRRDVALCAVVSVVIVFAGLDLVGKTCAAMAVALIS